jgi:protein-tyrosine phosphatase
MSPDLFWIRGPWTGRLAISTRPRGGDWLEDEVRGWRSASVDVVLSLLEKNEETQLELDEEPRLAHASGIRFISFPIIDRSVPTSVQATVSLLRDVSHALEEGKNVAIHCRQGIGRSGMIAAGALMIAGLNAGTALEAVGSARGLQVPETPEQLQWVQRILADRLVMAPR